MRRYSKKLTLCELRTRHVWFVSLGHPAGYDVKLESGSEYLLLPGDGYLPNGPWWDLNGRLDERGRWQWDGEGEPVDWNANSVINIVAFVPK